jgi:SAM-dependent methyltransferase
MSRAAVISLVNRGVLPAAAEVAARHAVHRWRRIIRPAWLGTLRRTTPLSAYWGYDRGTPIDRYYIEGFLAEHRADIRGRVLEIKNNAYTQRFGTGVSRSDVLDVDPANPHATIVADLAAAGAIPDDTFDCFIFTQTLNWIYDTRAALLHVRRILRPGGVVLATVSALARIDPDSRGLDYWRFTAASCAALFGDVFGPECVAVRAHGNVLAGIASLAGMAQEDLSRRELDAYDEAFPLIVTVRAVKQ